MCVSCECCVLSGTGLCVGPITRPEGVLLKVCVSESDRGISLRGSRPTRDVERLQKAGIYSITGIVRYKFTGFLGSWFHASYFNMHKYIQRDATVLSWLLFQEFYMFRAFTMPIIRSTLLHKQPLVEHTSVGS
jgi:hypothetical protein